MIISCSQLPIDFRGRRLQRCLLRQLRHELGRRRRRQRHASRVRRQRQLSRQNAALSRARAVWVNPLISLPPSLPPSFSQSRSLFLSFPFSLATDGRVAAIAGRRRCHTRRRRRRRRCERRSIDSGVIASPRDNMMRYDEKRRPCVFRGTLKLWLRSSKCFISQQ